MIQYNFNTLVFNRTTFNSGFYLAPHFIQAKGFIYPFRGSILFVRGNIRAPVSKTVQVKACILEVFSQTIGAKGVILRNFAQTISAKANIQNPWGILKTVRRITSKLEIQWDGVTWTDETDYFINAMGNEKLSKASGEGIASTLDVDLDNNTGRFTPNNTSSPIYAYIKPRVGIRVSIIFDDYTFRLFTGYIKNIHPNLKSGICELACFDNQVYVYNKRANSVVYEDYRSDQLMAVLAGLAGLEASQYSFDVGSLVVNFGYFEDRNVWPIMGEIAVAERGRIFFNRYGILTFWNRDRLHNVEANRVDLTLTDWITDLDYSVAEHAIKNKVIVKAQPRASAGIKQVWSSGNAEYLNPYTDTLVWIPANSVQSAWLELADPCTTFITPVKNTDYTANSAQDGSGDDLTGDIEVWEFIDYGNAIFITVINNGAVDAYLTKFQVRGNPAEILKWIKVTAEDTGSIGLYGPQIFEIENHFITNEDSAIAIADEELFRKKEAINLFRIDIIGNPFLACGDVVNVEYISGSFNKYMIGELNWTFDEVGFRQRLTLVNAYIFPSIQRIDAGANVLRHESESVTAKAKIT